MSQDYSQADFGAYLNAGAAQNVPKFYPPKRVRTGPHIDANGKYLQLNELEIFYEAGVGNGHSADPLATLEVSRDGGNTWRNVGTRHMGQAGQYRQRIVWRNLGRARTFTFRLTVTDPVRTYITGAEAKITVASK